MFVNKIYWYKLCPLLCSIVANLKMHDASSTTCEFCLVDSASLKTNVETWLLVKEYQLYKPFIPSEAALLRSCPASEVCYCPDNCPDHFVPVFKWFSEHRR